MVQRALKSLGFALAGLLAFVQWHGRAEDAGAPAPAAVKAAFRRPAGGPPFPEDNPFTQAKYDLGRTLFFEPMLSGSGTTSCASCHNPGLSWGDGLARAVGDAGSTMALRSPTLLNIAWLPLLGWDGKFHDIEQVTFVAITGRANMALGAEAAQQRLTAIPGYVDAFAAAFGDGAVTRERIEQAMATFERTLTSGPAPFDRWIDGDDGAIDSSAKRGFGLFTGRAGCADCHSGWTFTDGSFQDIGTARNGDLGRGQLFRSSVKLQYAFKVPTLRDVARRAPYMHDGSVPSLEAAIDLYDRGGIDRPSRSPSVRPLHLTPAEKSDLIAFLHTLDSDPEPFPVPVLPR